VEWRRFLVESLVLAVLIVLFGMLVIAVLMGFGGVLAAPCVVSLAFAIVKIARYER
jgi:predicted PurR-regulated permease PerM